MKTIEELKLELISELGKDNEDIIRVVSNTVFEFAQRWIPVSEELPESNHKEKILTKGTSGSMTKEEFIELTFYYKDRFRNECDWKYVTHWRPINLK